VALAYEIAIDKSQGSEVPAVLISLATEQYLPFPRNLVYSDSRIARNWWWSAVVRMALTNAVPNNKTEQRFSGLLARLKN